MEKIQTPNTVIVSLIPKFTKAENDIEGKYSDFTHINSVTLSSSTWILDSRATDHIVCSLNFFDKYHIVKGTMVNLPNGECVAFEHMGTVKLSNDMWLTDTLHIPSFKFNIVLASKLLQHSSHKLIFAFGQCTHQGDHGKMIGFVKEEKGLYLLKEPPITDSCRHYSMPCISVGLWHQRLGHYPLNKIHLLSGISTTNTKTLACDISHFAKQK